MTDQRARRARTRRCRAALTLTIFSTITLGTVVPASAGHQYLWWNEDGQSFATFGANASVSIYQGAIEYYNDSFYPTADIYVVPSGSVSAGSTLTDVAGTPNTVFGVSGGLFIDETIAFTAPGGNTPAGRYAVVYDEGQNKKFDGPDKLFDPAFEVVIPIDAPALPSAAIAAMKSNAGAQAQSWGRLVTAVEAIETLIKLKEAYDCLRLGPAGCAVSLATGWLQDQALAAARGGLGLQDVKDAAKDVVLDTIAHYAGIKADPPDPQFRQPSPLLPNVILDPGTADTIDRSEVAIGNTLATEASLAESMLRSIERYQGADAANNGDWALHHARAVKTRAQQLASQYSTTNGTLTAYRAALSADTRDFDIVAPRVEAGRRSVIDNGFATDQITALRNLGKTDAEIAGLRTWVGTQPDTGALTEAGLRAEVDSLVALNTDAATDMQTLASDMDAIISTLTAAGARDNAPVANAGGPYTVNEGTPISLTGSASSDPNGTITAWAWDLDRNGAFDDATGVAPSATFSRAFSGLVGLRVTDNSGQTGIGYARVTVNDSNGPPVVTATPADLSLEVPVNGSQVFTSTATDPNGDAMTTRWLVDLVQAGTGTSFTYNAPATVGMHTIRLEVADAASGGAIGVEWQVQTLFPDADADGWRSNLDCNDANPNINPGRPEVALNGIDDDCNPATSDNGSPPVAMFNPNGARNVALLEAGATVVSVSSQAPGCATAASMLNYAPDDCPWTTAAGQTSGTVKIGLAGGLTYLIDRVQVQPAPPGYVDTTQRVRTFEIATSTTTTADAAFTTRLVATTTNAATLQTFALPAPVMARYVRYRALTTHGSTCCVTTGQVKVLTGTQGGSTAVTFGNLSTDVNDDLAGFAWTFGDGATSTAANPSHTFASPGTYTVTLTATDSVGQTGTFSLQQRILSPPTGGAITVAPTTPAEGAVATYAASATDPDGGGIVARTTWTWGDASAPTTSDLLSAPHTFPENATYTVGVTVVDTQEQTATFQRTVTPINVAPVVDAGADRRAQGGQQLAFAAPVITDPGTLDTHTCSWAFGDGSPPAPGCANSHTYTLAPGATASQTFTATVTVTDDDGAFETDRVVVTVYPRVFSTVGAPVPGSSGMAWSALHQRFLIVRDAPCARTLASFAADGTLAGALTPAIAGQCGETPLTVSRGTTGFLNGSAYLGNGRPGEIVRVRFNADGTFAGMDNPWVPATTTASAGQLSSIRFDETGLLNNDLITVWSDGKVLRTAAGGATFLINNVARPVRGADVLPTGFAGHSGSVLTSDSHGNIYAVRAGSLPVIVGSVATDALPSALHVVTAPGDLYISDRATGKILRADSRTMKGTLLRHVLVPMGSGGEIYDLTFNPATNTFTTDLLALAFDAGAAVGAEESVFLPVLHSPASSIAPADVTKAVGGAHTITATMIDSAGNAVAGLGLMFTVLGSHPRTQTITTNTSGVAVLTYTGTSVGTDFISASSVYTATDNAIVRWRKVSTITASPVVLDGTTVQSGIRARLTDAGTNGPLPGKQVVFTTTNVQTGQPQEICRATTSGDGTAGCTGIAGQLPATLGNGYTATFAGDPVYLGSMAQAPVVRA